MEKKIVKGVKKGDILIFALSTCVWCAKTKKFLQDMGVEFSYIDVDLLEGEDKKKIDEELKKWNPRGSFPTVVIDNKKCIIGFKEDEIRQALIK